MAIRVHFTHSFDRILTIPRILISFILFFSVVGGFAFLLDTSDILGKLKTGVTINFIVFMALLFVSYGLTRYIYSKTAGRFFDTLSSYLYIKYKLKTKMSWKEADFVSFLFSPNGTGQWYPMKEVLKVSEEKRVSHIKYFAEKILSEYQVTNKNSA
jgi:hypothetical protein